MMPPIRSGRLVARMLLAALCLGASPDRSPAAPAGEVVGGRVIDLETDRPIAGAEVTASFTAGQSAGAGRREVKVVTDADGRFALELPEDADSGPRWMAKLRVHHPDYVDRASPNPYRLWQFLAPSRRGRRPEFHPITLQRGRDYTGQVIGPDGEPSAGVEVTGWSGGLPNPSPFLVDELKAVSDESGRFRLRMPPSAAMNLTFLPRDLAPYVHIKRQPQVPGQPAPMIDADLGRFILARGTTLSGRVIGRDEKPLTGVRLEAVSQNMGTIRRTVSDDRGEFRFPPVAPGIHVIQAADQSYNQQNGGEDRHPPGPPIPPEWVRVEAGAEPAPVELREVASVAITARFVDGRGRPVAGMVAWMNGQFPPTRAAARVGAPVARNLGIQADFVVFGDDGPHQIPAPNAPGAGMARLLAPLRVLMQVPRPPALAAAAAQDLGHMNRAWLARAESDASGRVTFHAPLGLLNAHLYSNDPSGALVLRARLKPGEPATANAAIPIAQVKEGVAGPEFLVARSATVRVELVTEDGAALPDQVNINTYHIEDGRTNHVGTFDREPDGRYRIVGVPPDRPFVVMASAAGYLQARYEGTSPPEGADLDVTLLLEKPSPPAQLGDLAPPILVTTIDGRAVSLGSFAGRYALIYVWTPAIIRNAPADLPMLKGLRERYGEDQLAMLGLNFDFNPDVTAMKKVVQEQQIAWPQARMGREFDALRVAYGWNGYPCAMLIGPDGTLVANNLRGEAIAKAVEDALK